MCTLVVAWGVFPDTPVAVAANRDERLDRPAVPPAIADTDPAVVAPRDEEAGGTWIGYNGHGVLAALTNRWTGGEREGDRSRGLLVRDALGAASAEDAARAIERELAERAYEPFFLLLADANAAILFAYDGRIQVSNLEPGVHVVMNVGYDDYFDVPEFRREPGERQVESAHLLREALQPGAGERAGSWLDRAGEALGDHDYGVCVHGDGFGTRSSSLIALHDDGSATYRYADGPPCETAHELVEDQV